MSHFESHLAAANLLLTVIWRICDYRVFIPISPLLEAKVKNAQTGGPHCGFLLGSLLPARAVIEGKLGTFLPAPGVFPQPDCAAFQTDIYAQFPRRVTSFRRCLLRVGAEGDLPENSTTLQR